MKRSYRDEQAKPYAENHSIQRHKGVGNEATVWRASLVASVVAPTHQINRYDGLELAPLEPVSEVKVSVIRQLAMAEGLCGTCRHCGSALTMR